MLVQPRSASQVLGSRAASAANGVLAAGSKRVTSSSRQLPASGGGAAPLSASRAAQQQQQQQQQLKRGALSLCRAGDIGAMLSGLKKALGGSGDAAPTTASASGGGAAAAPMAFADNAPSWAQLEALVRAQERELLAGGRSFLEPDLENGPTHPLALRRTFGSDAPIRVKLYRDHAAWCPYCQKVWLQLEEKRIPYVIEKINMRCYGDKPASFLSKVPSGLLPVLELDGRVVTESAAIMALLEEAFPDHKPLMPPPGAPLRPRADALMRLERRFFGAWLDWLCSGWNQAQAQANFERTVDAICEALEAEGGPFFLGSDISLVDITFAPMLERANASLAYYKGFFMRGKGRWPALDRWFEAMEARPTYLGTRSDHYTHCHDLPPQLGGCHMVEAGVPIAAQIDGEAPGAWRLPLPPLNASSLPEPYSPGEDAPRDRLEAAARMVANHAALVRFALRGPGRPGPRPVSAPLADPTAVPASDAAAAAAADAALRHVAHALLVGVDAKQLSKSEALQTAAAAAASGAGDGAALAGAPAVAAAAYLRDRVGVPRDMRLPAARQLRAHLNWLIDGLTVSSGAAA